MRRAREAGGRGDCTVRVRMPAVYSEIATGISRDCSSHKFGSLRPLYPKDHPDQLDLLGAAA